MATIAQPPAGQPMMATGMAGQPTFVPTGVAAAPQVQGAAPMPVMATQPGTVMYYPQMVGGAMITPVIATQAPKYEYVPNDFMVFSIITVILCGIFSPLSLVLSLPALFFSQQSKRNAILGVINEAKKQGMIAAYLNVAAIIAALLVACLIMGLVLGLYGPEYVRQQYCRNYSYSDRNSYSYYNSYSSYQRYCIG